MTEDGRRNSKTVTVRATLAKRIISCRRVVRGIMTTTVGVGTPFAMAEWQVRPGNEATFIEAWDRFARWTAEHQSGAIVGALLQDTADTHRFVSYGPWERPEQIAPWRATPEFQEAVGRFRELCETITPHTMTCVAIRGSSE